MGGTGEEQEDDDPKNRVQPAAVPSPVPRIDGAVQGVSRGRSVREKARRCATKRSSWRT